MTIIISCKCEHTFQDELYGKGRRVHNACLNNKARCTVCGDVKSISERDKKESV